MSFSLSDKQIEIVKYNNTIRPIHTILEGAVRSGKTFVMILLWLEHVQRYENKGRTFIMTGHTIGSLKRNVLDEMTALFGIDTHLNQQNEFTLFGNKIACFGSDKSDSYKSMKGLTAYGWLANEVTLQHKNTIDQSFKRCSGPGSRIFWDCNPDNPQHIVKKQYIDKSGEQLTDGTERIKAWHFSLDDNPFLEKNYIEALKKSTPTGHLYDRDILGLWVNAAGMIYKDFNPAKHIIKSTDKRLQRLIKYYAGVDWGYDHFGSIIVCGEDFDGNKYIVDEYAYRQKTIDFWKDCKSKITNKYGQMVFYCGPDRPDYIEEIKGVKANNSVIEGITYLAELFKNDKIFINEKCKKLLSEIYEYSWNDRTRKEEPLKENDDSIDALRYCLYSKKTLTAGADINELSAVNIESEYNL